MPLEKRNFLRFCLYHFFAFFSANRIYPEYVAECQLALWQSDCLQVEAKGHLPGVLKCSEMCSEFCKVQFSSSESSSLNSSPSRALRAFLLPFSWPLHGLSSVCGFPRGALPFTYRLECSVFIVALLGGVLEWPQMCLHRWRKLYMCWEVKGVCTQMLLCCCLCCVSIMDISVHLYCFLFEGVELGGHLCSKLPFLRCLVLSKGVTALLLGYLITSSWTPQSDWRSVWDPCWHPLMHPKSFVLSQLTALSVLIWRWYSRKASCWTGELSCLRFENKLRSTSKWCSSYP